MIEHVKNSIKKADLLESKLDPETLALNGQCNGRVRHLLNNIVDMPGARYLEVGVYKGATFIAALYKNNYDEATAIDSWSEPGDRRSDSDIILSKEEFINTCNHYIGHYDLIWDDCFNVELTNEVNIYFYDGNHLEESHAKALSHFYKSLANEIIFIVDDYNWNQVRMGTQRAVRDWTVLYESRLGPAGSHGAKTDWGRGIYIAVLRK